MEAKHTQGIWKMTDRKSEMGNNCGINIQCDDLIICRLPDGASTNGGYAFPHQLSNARLISAAPQLLEALQMMVMDLEHTGEIFGTDEKRIEFMSDVITRATGE